MRILLSNDDSVHAPGLAVMHDELKKLGQVTVVAPTEEKSTTGHNLTLHKPLRLIRMKNGFHAVSGSPADCVLVGLKELFKGKPDVVVSGINRGANLGQDVFYSGTVSAAREAAMLGIPALAISLAIDFNTAHGEENLHYKTAAKLLVKVIQKYDVTSLPKGTLLNVNAPDLPLSRVKGIQVARQGFRKYSSAILKRVDHRGRPYYWVGGKYLGFHRDPGGDCHVVDQGYASVTPLQLDCTHDGVMEELGEVWSVAQK